MLRSLVGSEMCIRDRLGVFGLMCATYASRRTLNMKLVSWLLISTGTLVLVGLLAFGLSGTIRDAVNGHITDVAERITVVDEVATGDVISTATFREDDIGNDAAHWVKGSVSIVEMDGKTYVQLNEDFQARPNTPNTCLLYTSPSPRDS